MAVCPWREINILVYILVIFLGIASWVDINGVWVELPILVLNLPEGWDLPSYMSIISQIANIAPLAYIICSTIWSHRLIEVPVIYIIIATGATSCLLLSFFWKCTTVIAGAERSTALFGLQFFLALVDTTSSVAFLPYMARFKPQYMTAYFIGEGFSGLIPSVVALGQGASEMTCFNASFNSTIVIFPKYEEPKFSASIFFLMLMGILILSLISFSLLTFSTFCKKEQVNQQAYQEEAGAMPYNTCAQLTSGLSNKSGAESGLKNLSRIDDEKSEIPDRNETKQNLAETKDSLKVIKQSKRVLFLLLTTWLCALSNGFMPSVQTYSGLPYGINEYHLVVTLSSIANPVACFTMFVVTMESTIVTVLMTLISTGLAAFITYTIAESPEPPLVHDAAGPYVIIIVWILVVYFMTYTKVSIATVFRGEGGKALLWVGAFTQIGSLIGAIVAFLLVNHYKLFKDANPCL